MAQKNKLPSDVVEALKQNSTEMRRSLEGRIEVLREARQNLTSAEREEVAAVRERHKAHRAAIEREIKGTRKMLSSMRRPYKRRKKPAESAGPANVTKVSDYLQRHGKATQAEVRRETGLNSGTASYAVRALVDDEQIALTGEKVNRSPVLEWKGERRALVALPGEGTRKGRKVPS